MRMNRTVRIGPKKIGDGAPCFIIAEAGSNHNGKLKQAFRLIDIAAEAGADAVKFQTFRAQTLYLKSAGRSDYLKIKKSIYDIIKEMEMPPAWIPKLAAHCKTKKILFLSTPTDEICADLLAPYVPAYKVASYEMTAAPLVEYLAKKGKPMLVSTGAADLKEVRETVEVIKKTGNRNLILLQSTAAYPAPLGAVNAKSILTMKQEFGVPVGLSDHSREWDVAPMAAVALGANCIEKHFTISNSLPGPDHQFALEPGELKQMVTKVRQVEQALGSGEKKVQQVEQELRKFARRSIFATHPIKKGEKFTRGNIATLRCGTQKGLLHPREFSNLLDRIAVRDIPAEGAIQAGDYARKS